MNRNSAEIARLRESLREKKHHADSRRREGGYNSSEFSYSHPSSNHSVRSHIYQLQPRSIDNSGQEYERPAIEPLFDQAEINQYGLHHKFQHYVAEQKRIESEGLGENERLQIDIDFERELFGLEYNINERVFGWCPCNIYETYLAPSTKYAMSLRCFAFLLLIVIYAVGLGCFILLHQRVETCDSDLINIKQIKDLDVSDKKVLLSCKGNADSCELGKQFINFKGYLQYRLASYFLLLVPFLYIPYMTALDISNTAGRIWEKFRGLDKKGLELVEGKKRNEHFQGTFKGIEFAMKRGYKAHINYSATDHERVVLNLFFVFHVILGSFSTAFDYLLMSQDFTSNSPCGILDNNLDKIRNGVEIRLKTAGTYLFSMDIILFAFTLFFMIQQLVATLYRSEVDKERRDLSKNMRHNQVHERLKLQNADLNRKRTEVQDKLRLISQGEYVEENS